MGVGPVCGTLLSTGLSEWELGPCHAEWSGAVQHDQIYDTYLLQGVCIPILPLCEVKIRARFLSVRFSCMCAIANTACLCGTAFVCVSVFHSTSHQEYFIFPVYTGISTVNTYLLDD